MEDASIKRIHEKRDEYNSKVLLSAVLIVIIVTTIYLSFFSIEIIALAYFVVLMLVSYIITKVIKKIGAIKISSTRKEVLTNYFPSISCIDNSYVHLSA